MSSIFWKIKTFELLNTAELYKILKLRTNVFVVEQNCAYPELDNKDQAAVHLWAEQDGEILAYCRIFPPGSNYTESSIGRVVTAPNRRKQNLGRHLMLLAIESIETHYHTSKIRISAQDYLLDFYKTFGFEDTGKKYLEDGIPHTEMLRS